MRRRRHRPFAALLIVASALGAATSAVGADTADVERVAGANRVETAIAASKEVNPDGVHGPAVVLASANSFADALVGVPLASTRGGPVLLTGRDALDPATEAEIGRVTDRSYAVVYILGGVAAIGAPVEARLHDLGYDVVRIAGANRFATAVAVARELDDPSLVLEATGVRFPDALAAGAAAGGNGGIVLLTNGPSQAPETAQYLADHPNATRFAIGGAAAAADPHAEAVAGGDRYETSARVAQRFFSAPFVAGVASGEQFPDALAGGAHAAAYGGPLLLTTPASLPGAVRDYLTANAQQIENAYVYGGTAAVRDAVLDQVQVAIT